MLQVVHVKSAVMLHKRLFETTCWSQTHTKRCLISYHFELPTTLPAIWTQWDPTFKSVTCNPIKAPPYKMHGDTRGLHKLPWAPQQLTVKIKATTGLIHGFLEKVELLHFIQDLYGERDLIRNPINFSVSGFSESLQLMKWFSRFSKQQSDCKITWLFHFCFY